MKSGVDFMPITTIHDYVEMKHNSGQIKIAISTCATLGLTNRSSPQKENFSVGSVREPLEVLHDH